MRRLVVTGALAALLVIACVSNGSIDPVVASPADAGSAPDGGATPLVDGGTSTPPLPDSSGPVPCTEGSYRTRPDCVDEAGALFVDGASGDDANSGMKASPLKTIDAALAKTNALIFVCAGDQAPVTIQRAVTIAGGFECKTWRYTGDKPRIRQDAAGSAVRVESVTGAVRLEDLELTSADATTDGGHSIAVHAIASTSVTLRACKITAGNGKSGTPGADGAGAGTSPTAAKGNDAFATGGGPPKGCTCDTGGTSTGGGGGGGSSTNPISLGGFPGQPLIPAKPVTANGLQGVANSTCAALEPNGSGNRGADAADALPAPAVAKRGTLDANGFVAGSGGDGPDGAVGQGGGGGASFNQYGGGGGACGGCGGHGGKGGQGGGASIAILSFESAIELIECVLATGTAGDGGAGGVGANGAAGGAGGKSSEAPPTKACPGGDGGTGGRGGAGAGGAGGSSIGILYSGTAPKLDQASTITPGAEGARGLGGNDGPPGLSAKTADANDL